jgi:hypothetical protein
VAVGEEVTDLASKDFFLKVLDRPHYPGEDAHGVPPWDGGYAAPVSKQIAAQGQ